MSATKLKRVGACEPGRSRTFAPPTIRTRPWHAMACAAALFCVPAHAISFGDALEAARNNDATYRAAGYEFDATRLGVPIARASLLPIVSLSAANAQVVGTRTFPNGLNQEVRVPLDYTAPQASLNMRVPIFNFEAISLYKQAQAQSEVAEAVFRSQGMDLMERLIAAYLQTLLSGEVLRLSEGQERSFELQAEQASQRMKRGEGTRVQVAQTAANVDLARARTLEARDQVDLARIRLERVTGVQGAMATELPQTVRVDPIFPDRLGDWIDLAVRQSPLLQARELNREVARQATRRQTAGHLPRLDLVASLARQRNDSTTAIGQTTSVRTVGLQLTVPLYSGGGVDASVQQARVRQSQIEEQVRSERDTLELEVQRHFQGVVNGDKRVAALVTAKASTELAQLGARRALETGLGTVSELADAQALSFAAARDLAQARIETLLSYARLLMQAGIPFHDISVAVDQFLAGGPLSSSGIQNEPSFTPR